MSEEKKKYIVVSAHSIPDLVDAVNGQNDYEPQGGILSAITVTSSEEYPMGWHQAMVLKEQPNIAKPFNPNQRYSVSYENGEVVVKEAPPEAWHEKAPYGFCPICGAKGYSRERRPDSNDTCVNGHRYKSSEALKEANKMSQEFIVNSNVAAMMVLEDKYSLEDISMLDSVDGDKIPHKVIYQKVIKKLQSELSALKAENEWVSVKDADLEGGKEYIVSNGSAVIDALKKYMIDRIGGAEIRIKIEVDNSGIPTTTILSMSVFKSSENWCVDKIVSYGDQSKDLSDLISRAKQKFDIWSRRNG